MAETTSLEEYESIVVIVMLEPLSIGDQIDFL